MRANATGRAADRSRLDDDQEEADAHPPADVGLLVTADIVCAYVSNNTLPARDLPMMIMSVYSALKNAAAAPSAKV